MTDEQREAIDDFSFFEEGEYITKKMAKSKDVVLDLLKDQENKIKELKEELNKETAIPVWRLDNPIPPRFVDWKIYS